MDSNVDSERHRRAYSRRNYWEKRSDLMYYHYVEYIIRTIGRDAVSLIDVGTGNSPYLEWFDWIDEKVSVDLANPYRSSTVQGIEADITKVDIAQKFDICTCLQVLEHIEDARPFAERLFALGRTVVISVPFGWVKGTTKGHVHDPVTVEKLRDWTGRDPDYQLTVSEPFRKRNGDRLIAVYLEEGLDPAVVFDHSRRRSAKSPR